MRIIRRRLRHTEDVQIGPYYIITDSTRWGVYATSAESPYVNDVYIPNGKYKELCVKELRAPVEDIEKLAKNMPFRYTHSLNTEWHAASNKTYDIIVLKNYKSNKLLLLIKPTLKRMLLTNKSLGVRVQYDRMLVIKTYETSDKNS